MKSTYISQITEQINAVTKSCGAVLLFGENIDKGSRIAGLARGLEVNPAGEILNVGNCELTHCGIGFGMMLDGGSSVLFMKQLDFLLLGLDQLVNTFNFIRAYRPSADMGSFTIYPIVCDQGYQGPQSSLNSAADFASLANIDVYCLNGSEDAAFVVSENFVRSGFRVICTSQRLFNEPSLDLPVLARSSRNAIFKYEAGGDVTVVCYNFALRKGLELSRYLHSHEIGADLFHSNFIPGMDMTMLIDSCEQTKKLVIIDDSKTVNKFGDILVAQLSAQNIHVAVSILGRRGCANEDYAVGEDRFHVDHDAVLAFVRNQIS